MGKIIKLDVKIREDKFQYEVGNKSCGTYCVACLKKENDKVFINLLDTDISKELDSNMSLIDVMGIVTNLELEILKQDNEERGTMFNAKLYFADGTSIVAEDLNNKKLRYIEEVYYEMRLQEITEEINKTMPKFVRSSLQQYLRD